MRSGILFAAVMGLGFAQATPLLFGGDAPTSTLSAHDSESVSPVNGSRVLGRGIQAHGGLEAWKSKGTLAYTLRDFPLTPALAKPNRSTIDLVSRFNHMKSDAFSAAWDGKDAWIAPTADAAGLPPRFFVRGSMYFLMMPFVFADAGVIATDAGTTSFKGESFDLVTVRFAEGVGDVSDGYELLFDRKTHQLRVINHSVKGAGIERVTWEFNTWQAVDGLLVPKTMTFHPDWKPNDPGAGKPVQVEDVQLGTARPKPSLFTQRPADAVVPK
jgi:hypothetical protein